VVYVVIDLAFGLLGVIVGRFIVAVLPLLVWTVWGVGLSRHWWGNDGEQIVLGTALLIAFGVASTAMGVGVNRLVNRRS